MKYECLLRYEMSPFHFVPSSFVRLVIDWFHFIFPLGMLLIPLFLTTVTKVSIFTRTTTAKATLMKTTTCMYRFLPPVYYGFCIHHPNVFCIITLCWRFGLTIMWIFTHWIWKPDRLRAVHNCLFVVLLYLLSSSLRSVHFYFCIFGLLDKHAE